MSDQEGTHRRTITLTIEIEDVTEATADEFARRLAQPGQDLALWLDDGLEYEAVVVG